jgi:hypothetical protein
LSYQAQLRKSAGFYKVQRNRKRENNQHDDQQPVAPGTWTALMPAGIIVHATLEFLSD